VGKDINQNISLQKDNKSTASRKIDLNDLLDRIKNEKKEESKINLLIVSGVVVVSVAVVLILSL